MDDLGCGRSPGAVRSAVLSRDGTRVVWVMEDNTVVSSRTITTAEGIRTVEGIIGKAVKMTQRPRRPGDQLKTHANIDKARTILGYNPTTTAREGLEKEVEWYRRHIFGKIDPWSGQG